MNFGKTKISLKSELFVGAKGLVSSPCGKHLTLERKSLTPVRLFVGAKGLEPLTPSV
jgi:hypothetical protein